MRQALAMIETRGLLAAIEATDVMLKAAEVHLLSRTLVGGGLVTILVEGDVASCKASIDAACSAVDRLGNDLLVSSHVIARPDDGLAAIVDQGSPQESELKDPDRDLEPTGSDMSSATASVEVFEEAEEIALISKPIEKPSLDTKADVDAVVQKDGLAMTMTELQGLRTTKLRNLARTYDDFPIAGREISRAKKGQLLEYFNAYYSSLLED